MWGINKMKKFKKILVANRGEIAIRIFRACGELGIRTVAIYSEEDKNALFRTKADESYQIGKGKGPVDAYLSINEIIDLAKAKGADAIHPGYGFLSENSDFAKQCEDAGIEFIGPTHEMMEQLGDKIKSKLVAHEVGVPTIPGVEEAIKSEEDAKKFAEFCGYPVMLKASAGGGGRGMRIVRNPEDLITEFNNAQSEARKAFGIDDIFIEKYLEEPKHIEVQVLGDKYGNIVHLYERDCSIQRRHQKVVEFSPALTITEEQRQAMCDQTGKTRQLPQCGYRGVPRGQARQPLFYRNESAYPGGAYRFRNGDGNRYRTVTDSYRRGISAGFRRGGHSESGCCRTAGRCNSVPNHHGRSDQRFCTGHW